MSLSNTRVGMGGRGEVFGGSELQKALRIYSYSLPSHPEEGGLQRGHH